MNEDAESDDVPQSEELSLPDPDGLLADLLGAPDRDRCPGARPVVAVTEEDPPEFIEEINARCVSAPTLERRGQHHGNWAELTDDLGFFPAEPLALLAKRWEEARPIVLHDALSEDVMELVRTDRRHAELLEPGGLRDWITQREAHLEPTFRVLPPERAAALTDERDIARVAIAHEGERGPAVDDLWIKTQRLSTHPDDRSLRVRFSFGNEVTDDASRDMDRHRLVAQVGERMVPELAALHRDGELRGLIGEWMHSRPLLTQAICYWNAPGGGALFHHDAFDEPSAGRQRGVLYAQLSGSTAWLALSLDDLAARVQEFTEELDDANLRDLVGQADGNDAAPTPRALISDERALRSELAQPGGGRLAALINNGPAFTSFLADAGHGFIVSEGDVILLPNHGLQDTCMHSVFCAGDEPAFSLSLALRDSILPGTSREEGKVGSRRSGRRSGGRKTRGSRGGRGSSGTRGRGPGSRRKRR